MVTRSPGTATLALLAALALPAPATALVVEFQEDLGNFPDAVEITGGVDVRGGRVGVVFGVRNTSYGDGGASSFERDPDGDFADDDVLTPEARAAISGAQPFGIWFFNAKLPEVFATGTVGGELSKPALFDFTVENSDDAGFREFNFTLSLDPAAGLLFDDDVPPGGVPGAFVDPRFGTLEFFVPAPETMTLEQVVALIASINVRNSPGIDVSTSMAWVDSTSGAIVTELFDEDLRPRGEIQSVLRVVGVPLPPTLLLLTGGAWLLALRRR